ncbi:MAG: lipid-A-disaccharide synthase [Deltaproteobacteria bacterium]|nr:lipid-A-disaccharide synthase [Deltaproteobacteria bacterium]MCL5278195.1 lipid-A-disaccharide synthase [Deltaproteobacteria bacterium]
MKRVLIIAGEPSADMHGAGLVRAIRAQLAGMPGKGTEIEFVGIGGRLMREAGVNIVFDADRIAVVGISEVIRHLGSIRSAFATAVSAALDNHVDLGILIDFPDFNLRLAKRLSRHRIPLVYYIPPQVWAWRKGRIKKIARYFRKVLVIFRFEEAFYRDAGIDAAFVGHPLAGEVRMSDSKENLLKRYGIPPGNRVVALLPGSRTAEVKRHLPIMLDAARYLQDAHKDLSFVVPVLGPQAQTCSRTMHGHDVRAGLILDDTYNAVGMSDFAVVTSGTATLETALLSIPMIVVYKVSFPSHMVARALVSVKRIGIVNIATGKDMVPELVQDDLKPERLAAMIEMFLKDREAYDRMKKDYAELRGILGDADASQMAGGHIVRLLGAVQ